MSAWSQVMVIDDSAPDLLLAELMLSGPGLAGEVLCFERAAEALDHLRSPAGQQVELVLLDINMPGMNGFQFLDAYDAPHLEGRCPAPVVVLTSSPDPQEHQRVLAHAAVREVMVKPPTPQGFEALAARLAA